MLLERVGAGALSAVIMKQRAGGGWPCYRFMIVHDHRSSRRAWLKPESLLDLPRLAQLTAQVLLDDGCLVETFKDDLRALLAAIDLVESRPQPYFVCSACNAKWFGRSSAMPCPRCFVPAVSNERLHLPWRRD